ncbi:hypothetical protein SAMN05428988_2916 [Chitinophaga sp. YR573]|uniref:hypothetical protein n=1 Tax=Chitinophaga sp. YR573 TaxID=1881040 RepID=UPI0008D07873|nr:hypothetical protein [Chitinophaga sp. YR573]SEW18912.1 hypothetical protein SAMN05428988_2916 [Chitinophaga sp. YR573]
MINKFKKILYAFRAVNESVLLNREILKAQVFTSTIENSRWLKNKSFSPGGWAVDYGVLYTLYRILNDVKPKNVLEFGLGQSSKMIHQYSSYFTDSTAETFEHDEEWIQFFKDGLAGDYTTNVSVCELEKKELNGFETLIYKNITSHVGNKKYNLILVDGPYGSPRYSRHQIVDLVPQNLDTSFCILLDDYNRIGEQDTFNDICAVLTANKIEYVTGNYLTMKGHAVICSKDLKFITTL